MSTSASGFKLDIGLVDRVEDRSDFLSAAGRLDVRAIRHLVETKGVDVNSEDSVGQNCLHFVSCSAETDAETQTKLLGYLTRAGADPNKRRDTDGWTPLFLAVIFGRRQVVAALLANGAAASARDADGKTPEDWAERYRVWHVKDLLVHSRSKVPHSRFSCVQQGPALEPSSPSSTEESDTPTSSASIPLAAENSSNNSEATEACLLTAQ